MSKCIVRAVLTLFLAHTSDPSSINRSSSAALLSFTAYISGVIPVTCGEARETLTRSDNSANKYSIQFDSIYLNSVHFFFIYVLTQ
jgi:hypothetical protein